MLNNFSCQPKLQPKPNLGPNIIKFSPTNIRNTPRISSAQYLQYQISTNTTWERPQHSTLLPLHKPSVAQKLPSDHHIQLLPVCRIIQTNEEARTGEVETQPWVLKLQLDFNCPKELSIHMHANTGKGKVLSFLVFCVPAVQAYPSINPHCIHTSLRSTRMFHRTNNTMRSTAGQIQLLPVWRIIQRSDRDEITSLLQPAAILPKPEKCLNQIQSDKY